MDVTDHEAVPEHRVMEEEEVEELLDRYGAEMSQLPRIERTDAALKQKEVEEGDVVEIVRESPTAGKATYYRRVVEP